MLESVNIEIELESAYVNCVCLEGLSSFISSLWR